MTARAPLSPSPRAPQRRARTRCQMPPGHAAGERNPNAKLTATDVVTLREAAARLTSPAVRRLLATEYGITMTEFGQIIHGGTWKEVGGPIQPKRTHRLAGHGPHFCAKDGFPLEYDTDGAGHAIARCGGCERRRARLCMDCGYPVRGRAWRCERHRAEAQARAVARSEARHREERLRAEKARYRNHTPEQRAHRLAVKKAWRERNPKKLAAYKRKARLERRPGGYATREKGLAYYRDYNARHREQHRQQERERYRRLHPVPPAPHCVDCGVAIPWTPGRGRPPKRCAQHRGYIPVAKRSAKRAAVRSARSANAASARAA